eukprot:TRINITY_DN93222_c0_g1_i1.p1 TRINITY_DN93222_c0_g1~~TRINITY_DN93222_c0_g1_i1.p1  ORF type:complete len:305 (+),score=80.83 TRINITY_DN93222_c0_g1_i1:44-958(+)
MASDFRAPPKGQENQLSKEFGGFKPQLDGSWSFQAQFNAIAAMSAEDDWSFKEGSVKDVTDRGRGEAVRKLQDALEDTIEKNPPPARLSSLLYRPGRQCDEDEEDGGIAKAAAADAAVAEVQLRKDVRSLLAPLRELEKLPPSGSRNGAALDIFRQLKRLRITVDCLKATKIAVELNKPCWRGALASKDVQEAAGALVKNWRSMYRTQTGQSVEKYSQRRFRLVAVDMEESTYGANPKMAQYCKTVDRLCKELRKDPELCRELLAGTSSGAELRLRVGERVKGEQLTKRRNKSEAAPPPKFLPT